MTELPKTENLLHERKGGVLHVTFNRPQGRNAMSTALRQEIVDQSLLLGAQRLSDAAAIQPGEGGGIAFFICAHARCARRAEGGLSSRI